ncbi:STAS domain-containing protein [soil metagenome]
MVDEASAPDRQRPSEPGGCTLATTWAGRIAVLTATGTVDVLTAPQLIEAVDALLTESPSAVIVDLTDVDFLASAGMSALINAHEKVAGSGSFGVVASGSVTSRPMRLVGLHEVISLYETLDEAMKGAGDE